MGIGNFNHFKLDSEHLSCAWIPALFISYWVGSSPQ